MKAAEAAQHKRHEARIGRAWPYLMCLDVALETRVRPCTLRFLKKLRVPVLIHWALPLGTGRTGVNAIRSTALVHEHVPGSRGLVADSLQERVPVQFQRPHPPLSLPDSARDTCTLEPASVCGAHQHLQHAAYGIKFYNLDLAMVRVERRLRA